MSGQRLRHSVRALIVDPDERVLLCRFDHTGDQGVVVWAAPGGGVEDGESPYQALRRELLEETGLRLDHEPPHVWHQEVVGPGHAAGHDGAVNDFYLVRTRAFRPRGVLSDAALAAEGITRLRWWPHREVAAYTGPDVFGPRDLGNALATLLKRGVPDRPLVFGL